MANPTSNVSAIPRTPKPRWLKVKAPLSAECLQVERLLRELQLHTVCQSATCPNRGQCWSEHEAAFMILGNVCTRRCGFCDVTTGRPRPVDLEEPNRLAHAATLLGLKHVVITSVNRDDLDDGGAFQFAACVEALRTATTPPTVEVLTPDFQGNLSSLDRVLDARPDVFNLNIETVSHLYPRVRPASNYQRVLDLLSHAHFRRQAAVKSGIMLGLGEEPEEVIQTLNDLRASGVTMITIGQYLRPSPAHLPVVRYVPPEEFEHIGQKARELGFLRVASHPLARSSFHAERLFHGSPS
ncbi:MAG: lipoyl synthase [Magnetococcales bacterium]|nr:lipoyl synthase [Magnetococcales bacterium]MBF0151215.1 lipoyl synthase [Magnetococcales bacterium]MBF0173072.1 lipoyl synthase [Magnetococcales bacterium]MBF0347242.1 lipoyl synthase [Magnetococcales bacterium]MBF0630153.1 lipoyl synthase [Magnetococcales bacterium]